MVDVPECHRPRTGVERCTCKCRVLEVSAEMGMAFAELLEGDVVMLVKARREDLKGGYGQCEQSCILSSRGSEALTALKSGDPVKGDVVQKLLHV